LATTRVAEATQASKNAELESVVSAQVQKIAELEVVYASLKWEKENIIASYRWLSDKYKMFVAKAELTETHAVEFDGVKEELDKETHDYTDYRLNVWRRLRGLHEVVASSFGEVKARCLP
jgi:predicted nuclease with TOPRIM domain